MKKTLLLLLMISSLEGFSQIVAPQPSPSVTLNQTADPLSPRRPICAHSIRNKSGAEMSNPTPHHTQGEYR